MDFSKYGFIVRLGDNIPNPQRTTSNNKYWNGEIVYALVYRSQDDAWFEYKFDPSNPGNGRNISHHVVHINEETDLYLRMKYL